MEVFSRVERVMAPMDDTAVYDDLLDLLAESADAERVLAFRLSAPIARGR